MNFNTRKLTKKDEGLHLLSCDDATGPYWELVILEKGMVFDYPEKSFSEPISEFYKQGILMINKWAKL